MRGLRDKKSTRLAHAKKSPAIAGETAVRLWHTVGSDYGRLVFFKEQLDVTY